jgi:ABC-type polysaccharide/polyol phosphate export permease
MIQLSRGHYIYEGVQPPWSGGRESLALVYHLAKRQLMIRYHGSALGFLWSLLNPLFNMLLFMFLFKVVMRLEIPNVSYAAFFLTGYLLWNCLAQCLTNNLSVMMECKPLLDSHHFPAWALPISRVAAAFFNLLLTLPLLVAVNWTLGAPPSLKLLLLPLALALAFCFASGVALLVSSITPYFRDLAQMSDVILTVLYFASPILYPYSRIQTAPMPHWLPDWVFETLYQMNPVTGLVELMHYCFLPMNIAWSVAAWSALGSLAILAWGAWEFARRRDDFHTVV